MHEPKTCSVPGKSVDFLALCEAPLMDDWHVGVCTLSNKNKLHANNATNLSTFILSSASHTKRQWTNLSETKFVVAYFAY